MNELNDFKNYVNKYVILTRNEEEYVYFDSEYLGHNEYVHSVKWKLYVHNCNKNGIVNLFDMLVSGLKADYSVKFDPSCNGAAYVKIEFSIKESELSKLNNKISRKTESKLLANKESKLPITKSKSYTLTNIIYQ